MKVLLSIFLFVFTFLPVHAQDVWLLDSLHTQVEKNSVALEPSFAKYSYNAEGKVTKVRRKDYIYTYHYDLRRTEKKKFARNDIEPKLIERTVKKFNANSQLLSRELFTIGEDGREYLKRSRVNTYKDGLKVMSERGTSVFQYKYNDLGQRSVVQTFADGVLESIYEYTYDDKGRKVSDIATHIDSKSRASYYEYDENGKVLRHELRSDSDEFNEVQITDYFRGINCDTSIYKVSTDVENEAFSYSVNVNYQLDGDDVIDTYKLEDGNVESAFLRKRKISRINSFPHGNRKSSESYRIIGDEMKLINAITFELLSKEEDSYILLSTYKSFKLNGEIRNTREQVRKYVKVRKEQEQEVHVQATLSPNPISTTEELTIVLDGNLFSKCLILNSTGSASQELDIEGKTQITWIAPDAPGQYYIVFYNKNGSRSKAKVVQVF